MLETLDLSGTSVTDLSALKDLANLEALNLSSTGVSDLSSLTGLDSLTALETLDLSNNKGITDLSDLKDLANLKALNLSSTGLTNDGLSSLSGLPQTLETLDISDTGVTALDNLIAEDEQNFPGYVNLTARNLTLTSISALAEITKKEWFTANSIEKWDFDDSTLPDTEENQTAVETIRNVLTKSNQFIPPKFLQTTPVEPPVEPDTPVVPSGSGEDDDDDGYAVSVPASSSIRGGSITVSPRSADKGDTVTITVKPDDGYELDKLTVTDSKGGELKLSTRDGSKYTFTMPASLVNVKVSFRLIETGPVNPFTDVSQGDYYYDAVLWAVEKGVTAGTSATTFGPHVTVTRAQAMTFLWRAHGSPRAAGSNPFTDVSRSDYYYDAVLWAVENGVTSGTSATTFSPNAPVTRAQAMTFQWRAAGSPIVAGDSFDDVAADAYYAGAVTWAVANGITNGTGGNTFSPDSPVTRAQAVTFLWKELA